MSTEAWKSRWRTRDSHIPTAPRPRGPWTRTSEKRGHLKSVISGLGPSVLTTRSSDPTALRLPSQRPSRYVSPRVSSMTSFCCSSLLFCCLAPTRHRWDQSSGGSSSESCTTRRWRACGARPWANGSAASELSASPEGIRPECRERSFAPCYIQPRGAPTVLSRGSSPVAARGPRWWRASRFSCPTGWSYCCSARHVGRMDSPLYTT